MVGRVGLTKALLKLQEISTMAASHTGSFGRACWELVMLLLKVPGFVLYIFSRREAEKQPERSGKQNGVEC